MTTPPLATKTTLSTTAVNTKPLAAVVAGQTSLNATKPVQHQGTADTNPDSNNPPQGFDGPSPNLPGVSKASADSFAPQSSSDKQTSVEQALGLVSQSAALQSLSGLGTSAPTSQTQREKLTDLQGSIGTNQSPGFDQGFDSKPSNLGSNTISSETAGAVSSIGGSDSSSNSATGAVSAGGGTAFNPMDVFSGGSVGGPLAAAAAASQTTPQPGSGAAGSGLVSDQTYPGVTSAANAKTNSDGEVSEKRPTGGAGKEWKDKLFLEKLADVITGMRNMDGTLTEKGKALQEAQKAEAGIPNPENTGSNVNIITQTLLDQLNAANAGNPTSQGGSGDATPVTEGGSDPVVRNGSIAVNQSSLQGRNLFGQPGGSALGENVSGGDKGLNGFSGSNGAGVINPGPDAGSPGGDPRFQQDPGAVLGGNQPAPQFPPAGGGSQDNVSSSVSATLTAGARNLTLTGTATINGTGNALDNLINGNAAANELRGEGGNDTLDGKGGNDLLEGGAGQDQLTGGTGADRFRFATGAAFGAGGADRITDFSRSEGDRIEISRSAFGLGTGATVSFQAVGSDLDLTRALSTGTLLVQDLRDGSLLFNQNGSAAGAGLGGLFATVNPELTLQASDFALIG